MDALGGPDGMGVPNMPNDPMPMDGGDPNMMGNEPNDMGEGPMDDVNLDGNFDAGVEASPEEDPKKYLQQLTGKLSQELRKYNTEQEMPDEDLNKYIAGMILKQTSDGLTNKGKEEVIKKLKADPSDNMSDSSDEMATESVIKEVINNILGDDEALEKRKEKRICNKLLPKNSPFRSGR